MRRNEQIEHDLDVIDAVVKGGGESRPDDAALVDFALLVRGVRPVPGVAETTAIDDRVRALHARPSKRRGSSRTLLIAAAASMVLVAASVVAGINSISGEDQSGPDTAAPFAPEAEGEAGSSTDRAGAQDLAELTTSDDSRPEGAKFAQEAAPANTPTLTGGPRQVASNTVLVLSSPGEKIEGVADEVVAITDRAGGFVQNSSVTGGAGDRGGASFLLMVPAANYERAIAELSKAAHVRSRQQSTEDITTRVRAGNKRLRTARARVDRLENELAAASTDADRNRLKLELRRARVQEERATRSVARNKLRVNYVPVDLTISASAAAADSRDGTVGRALDTAWSILQAVAAAIVIALAVILPIAVIGGAAWLGLRLRRRRMAAAVIKDAAGQAE